MFLSGHCYTLCPGRVLSLWYSLNQIHLSLTLVASLGTQPWTYFPLPSLETGLEGRELFFLLYQSQNIFWKNYFYYLTAIF